MWRASPCSCTVFSNRPIKSLEVISGIKNNGHKWDTVPDMHPFQKNWGFILWWQFVHVHTWSWLCQRKWRKASLSRSTQVVVEKQVCTATRFTRRMKAGVREVPLEPTRSLTPLSGHTTNTHSNLFTISAERAKITTGWYGCHNENTIRDSVQIQ